MKTIQALEDSNIFLKGVTKTIKNETKVQKGGFSSLLLGTLGASLETFQQEKELQEQFLKTKKEKEL